jgi:hypothetical protein
MVKQIREMLTGKDLKPFVTEISLDGLSEFHSGFRVSPGSFEKAMQTMTRWTSCKRATHAYASTPSRRLPMSTWRKSAI